MQDDGRFRLECKTPRAMIRYSEASNFKALSSAKESNLQAEVLSLFSGQQIGDYTKNKELSVTIPEHGYRTAVVISAQPSMMGMFEVGVGVGFQQRFLYVSAYSDRLNVRALDEDPVALSSLTRFPYDTGLLPVDYPIEQMNRLYECGSYAKANDSTPDSSHLEKRPMRLPPIAIAEMRADKIRVNRSMAAIRAGPTACSCVPNCRRPSACLKTRLSFEIMQGGLGTRGHDDALLASMLRGKPARV